MYFNCLIIRKKYDIEIFMFFFYSSLFFSMFDTGICMCKITNKYT